MKKIVMFLILSFLLIGCNSEDVKKTTDEKENIQRQVLVFEKSDGVSFKVSDTFIDISILADDIYNISYREMGRGITNTEVVGRRSWDKVDFSLEKGEINVSVSTTAGKIIFNKKDNSISVYDNNDELLFTQKSTFMDTLSKASFNTPIQSTYYGVHGYDAWEDSSDGLTRNGRMVVEAGEQGDCGAPLIWTTDGYGLLFDSIDGVITVDEKSLDFDGNSKSNLEYFIALGEPKDIMTSVFKISGTSPMFPKWAMGFNNSEWGMDEKELRDIVNTYREKEIPIDNYTLDFDWKAWGEDNYGEFRWNNDKFPEGPSGKLSEDLSKQGIKLTGIYKPRLIVEDTIQGRYAKKHGYFIKNQQPYSEYFSKLLANDIDFSNPSAGAWYFEHVKDSIDTGIQGFWNDEADEGFSSLQHLLMQRSLYLGQRGYNNKRVWSINRNFYLGAQKYAYGMWSGDINSGFDSMANQRERMLSAVNLGQVKWGMDTGGFNGLDPTPENYARWIQFSAFTPLFRVHASQDKQRQPWMFGEKAEKASKQIMQLRYKLLPYIYSYERESYESGLGLVRPLLYESPKDLILENYYDGWYFGEELIVYPIVEKGQLKKEIYLPKGEWIHFFTGKTFEGESNYELDCDSKEWLDVPLFIKKGSIIPMQEYQNYVGEKEIYDYQLNIFPHEELSDFHFYEDDGQTYNYENGQYYKQLITVKEKDDVELTFNSPTGTFDLSGKDFIVKVYTDKTEVLSNQQEINSQIKSDKYGQYVEFILPLNKAHKIKIK